MIETKTLQMRSYGHNEYHTLEKQRYHRIFMVSYRNPVSFEVTISFLMFLWLRMKEHRKYDQSMAHEFHPVINMMVSNE